MTYDEPVQLLLPRGLLIKSLSTCKHCGQGKIGLLAYFCTCPGALAYGASPAEQDRIEEEQEARIAEAIKAALSPEDFQFYEERMKRDDY